MKTRNKNVIQALGLLIAGVLLGWLLFGGSEPSEAETHEHSEVAEQAWTCSMHPEVRRSEPGDCPICGMDLIPIQTEEGATGDTNTYMMSENAMKLANISTMTVGRGEASREIRVNGKIEVDERNAVSQSSHIPGRIEQLNINFTGERVNRGQTLAIIYSPEMVTAQEELLQAFQIREDQPELFEAAKEKLRNWRIGENQIKEILDRGKALQRFPVKADVSGIVTEKLVDLGDYVERGMPIYEISDLSKVWVLFDLYESQLGWVSEGSEVEYTVRSLPGETFEGEISFIDPVLNSRTRVATARVEVDNNQGRLKPEMFVSGTVKSDIGEASSTEIVVPKTAVLWTGKRSLVYVKEDMGNQVGFNLREVVLGPSLGDEYVIEEGLLVGEEIVMNGTFTVDAAVQLAGKPSMMNPELSSEDAAGTRKDISEYLQAPPDLRQETPEAFRKSLDHLIQAYMNLKDALVEGHEERTSTFSRQFMDRLQGISGEILSGKTESFWQEQQQVLSDHALISLEAADIHEKRENFVFLSEAMIKTLVAFGGADQNVYIDYCPMANNDKGAYWLSSEENIRNPYFGDSMLTCGEIVEQIK